MTDQEWEPIRLAYAEAEALKTAWLYRREVTQAAQAVEDRTGEAWLAACTHAETLAKYAFCPAPDEQKKEQPR